MVEEKKEHDQGCTPGDGMHCKCHCHLPLGHPGRQAQPPSPEPAPVTDAEALAKRFHESYERLAAQFGYKTRKESAVSWKDVPLQNRELMMAVVSKVVLADRARAQERIVAQHEEILGIQRELQDAKDELRWAKAQGVPDA